MVSDRAFIFDICIPWGKTLSFIQSQGHISMSNIKFAVFEKNGHMGGGGGTLVFHKYSFFCVWKGEGGEEREKMWRFC